MFEGKQLKFRVTAFIYIPQVNPMWFSTGKVTHYLHPLSVETFSMRSDGVTSPFPPPWKHLFIAGHGYIKSSVVFMTEWESWEKSTHIPIQVEKFFVVFMKASVEGKAAEWFPCTKLKLPHTET